MSNLLRHLSKLYHRKPKDALTNQNVRLSQTPPYLAIGVCRKEDGYSRNVDLDLYNPVKEETITISDTTLPPPYLTFGSRPKEDGYSTNVDPGADPLTIWDLKLYNPVKEETTTISDKTLPEELERLRLMGMSHGWGVFADDDDSSVVRMSNFFLPSSCKSSPKITHLPPLCPLPDYTMESVECVSMSSFPDQEEDCVVAIKFKGFQLSLCVLGRDSEWTNITTPFDYFYNSSTLTYSKRDQSFYMLAPGSHFLASWHIHSKNWDDPKFHELGFHNIPNFSQSQWEQLESCAKTEHFVEAPSGECFLVKWFGESLPCVFNEKETIHYRTKRFMVFRQEEASKDGGRIMRYTEDIGDVCIFLAKNEPFCVQASSYPGLKPNSIYFMGYGFGVYDLGNSICYSFSSHDHEGLPGSVFVCPYWIPPVYL